MWKWKTNRTKVYQGTAGSVLVFRVFGLFWDFFLLVVSLIVFSSFLFAVVSLVQVWRFHCWFICWFIYQFSY
jgi:hypothetical protein